MRVSKLILAFILASSSIFSLVACSDGGTKEEYSGYSYDSEEDSVRVIADGPVGISALEYEYSNFTLWDAGTVRVSVTSDDTDNDLQMYLMDSANFEKFQNTSTRASASYYTGLSSSTGTYSYYGSLTVPAGTYYYVILNTAILESHIVTRRISVEY